MEQRSPFLLIKSLETQLNGVLSALDIYDLPAVERKLVLTLKRDLTDARLDVRDYELSETRNEQLIKAKEAKQRIDQIRGEIMTLSEYNVFSVIDVAQLTAQLEQISEQLE